MQAEEGCIAGQVDKTQYVIYAAGRAWKDFHCIIGMAAAVMLLKCTTGIALCSDVN